MILHSCEQYSDEWWGLRTIPTSSGFSRIVKADGKASTQRKAYLYKLAAFRLTGIRNEGFQSKAMETGHDHEEISRMIYAMETESIVEQVGFCVSDCGRWGASPDGLVGEDGCLELKNPEAHTHLEWLDGGKLPAKHWHQVQGQLLTTSRPWCDFCSYSPKLPLFIVRVTRDDIFCDMLEAALIKFCEELDDICEKIKGGS